VKDMRTKKCGCIVFKVGPTVLCGKHEAREALIEERTLRRAARDAAAEKGHKLGDFTEYESCPGKWTAFCQTCGLIVIVYDEPQADVDQVFGWALSRKCHRLETTAA
jgi:hypothetical protein